MKCNYASAAILAAVLCISGTVLAYSGGNGSAGNPYQISNIPNWQELMASPGDWGSSFILTADINLAGVTLTPVGNIDYPFTGVFDGNKHCIRNAVINQPGNYFVGLFGYLENGQIRNLGVEDVNIVGNIIVGGLVGDNFGTITACYATGTVSGDYAVGGLAGTTGISMLNCYATCSVVANHQVGGLAGGNSGTLNSCYATGSVSGTSDEVGGLVGVGGNNGTLTNCYATGSVSGSSNVGGLAGTNNGTVTSCYATGSVSGDYCVGGLSGTNSSLYLTNCYATGSATGTGSCVGGLVGENIGTLTTCYATGRVIGTGEEVGGLVGRNWNGTGMLTACFWDKETSGQPTNDGGTGKTTAQMKMLSTFTAAGWNFATIWNIIENQTYPFSKRAGYSGGAGTTLAPYKIARVDDLLEWVTNTGDYDANFILTANVNLTGPTFTRALIAPDTNNATSGFQGTEFTGTFDGNGHTISNLTITAPTQDFIGLFGYVGSVGQIRNLGVENVNITGRDYVSGLVGLNAGGSLISCYVTGSVTGIGEWDVGGLVGYNGGTLTTCYSTGSVDGSLAGGLVGANYGGTLTSCYATGSVTGISYAGGLVGENTSGTVTDCYATGSVTGDYAVGGLMAEYYSGTLTACFWDTQTSGQPTSDGGTGRNTAQMKTLSTFTSAGWDFASIWAMPLGQYPVLFLRQMGDLNSDARVNMQDLAILAAHWLEGV